MAGICVDLRTLRLSLAIRGGLQDADAKELVQNVMLSVAKAVGRRRPDSKRAKFRTWLFRIARNQLLDELSKQSRQTVARGGSSFVGLLNQFAASTGSAKQQLRLENRRSSVVQATRRSL